MKTGTTAAEIIWYFMSLAYGRRWTRPHGRYDDGSWQAAIGVFDPLTVSLAITEAVRFYNNAPPTLEQFKYLCRDVREDHIQPQLEPGDDSMTQARHREWIRGVASLIGRRSKRDIDPMSETERVFHLKVLGMDEGQQK